MRLALFEPEIPQNTGTLLRLGACLGIGVDIIEPCGFVLHERRMRRAGMDYITLANMTRHDSWDAFFQKASSQGQRLVLLDPAGTQSHVSYSFSSKDTLVLGRESNGFSEEVLSQVTERVCIPMKEGTRSLNVAVAGALVLGEALRQVDGFAELSSEQQG